MENSEKQPKRKPKAIGQRNENAEPTILDQFVTKTSGSGDTQEEVVMNEDGTMGAYISKKL